MFVYINYIGIGLILYTADVRLVRRPFARHCEKPFAKPFAKPPQSLPQSHSQSHSQSRLRKAVRLRIGAPLLFARLDL